MAKSKSEPSQAQKEATAARERVKTAEANLEKAKTPANEKALEHAKAQLATARKAENVDRFNRVGGPRVSAAIVALENIGKLAAASYEYDDAQISKAEAALQAALNKAMTALRAAKSKTGSKAAAKFTF
jgi:predicted  nucleic acid-binding Zn-ribbon protein